MQSNNRDHLPDMPKDLSDKLHDLLMELDKTDYQYGNIEERFVL